MGRAIKREMIEMDINTLAIPERIVKKSRQFIEAVEIIQPAWLKRPLIKKEEPIEDKVVKKEEEFLNV